jgi:hypothetical protein
MVRFITIFTAAATLVVATALIIASHRTTAADAAMAGGPASGFTLHIDAEQHFGDAHPKEIAHHWCKNISASMIECLLFDSDRLDAKLVGVETVVPTTLWKTFGADEQALWHDHATEIPKVHATLPDTPKDQQAKIVASLMKTHGKIYVLWDPMSSANPVGQPSVTILHLH